jgi:hypothetical protein
MSVKMTEYFKQRKGAQWSVFASLFVKTVSVYSIKEMRPTVISS